MEEIRVTFPDGNNRNYPKGVTGEEIAVSISPNFAKKVYAAKVNGNEQELRIPINSDSEVFFLQFNDSYATETFRHSSAHILAQAIKRIYPNAQLGFGPAIEDGFFYDILLEERITEEDFPKIEAEVKKIVKENHQIIRKEWELDQAVDYFKSVGEDLKAEHISEIHQRGEKISVYTQGEFTDLCAGPHLPSTGKMGKYFKVLSVSGAYWKGREDQEMLQRIYATVFPGKEELNDYLHRIEEAKKRDHRRLGKDLKLFSFHGDVAAASPFFLPKGTIIYNELLNYIRNLYLKNDYKEVITPQILDVELWHCSGHYDNYKENMYFTTIDDREFAVKPMNCPTHALIFSEDNHSYRDLPIRIADFGRLHRYESSGATHGLTRVRTFSQDDAHIFCREDQIQDEVSNVIKMIKDVYHTFGFNDIQIELSTRPEKSVGSDKMWEQAESALKQALESNQINYEVNEGDGAFYGPKIDFQIRDALKRSWQLGTCQLDFSMPERFKLKFKNESSEDERPVMIHRAMLGSVERFMGILIEHFAGNFPLWLSPTQITLLAVADRHLDYCYKLQKYFKDKNIRCSVDDRREKIGYKIREAEIQKIPYMIVVGDRELENGDLSVRHKTDGDLGTLKQSELLERMQDEIKDKKLKTKN